MKIGFVSSHTFTYPGGVQKHTLALKMGFERRGHKVKLIFPRENLFQKKGKDTILLGRAFEISGNASKSNLSFNLTPFSIFQTLRKERFDILHFQNFGLFLPWQVLETSKTFFKKTTTILTFHAFLDASIFLKQISTFKTILNKYILPKFDGIIGVSKPVLSQIDYNGPKVIIPNGVDNKLFYPKGEKIEKFISSKKDRQSFINILFVGRIEKRKGLIYLVKAFEILRKKYENLRLIVVGEGDKREEIEDFVREHRIPDVFFEGEVKEKELPKYYRTADICCFPSIYGEGFGIVLLEAMASGKPVVAFANEGYKQVLTGKGAEFLVKPRDFQGLAEKLEILIKDENKRKEMGKWGEKEARKYCWEEIVDKTLKFYERVIEYKK